MSTSNILFTRMEQQRRLQAAVNKVLEDRYQRGKKTGIELANQWGSEKNSQIRNLENLIYTTGRYSEIYNFIENQTGKDKAKKTWAISYENATLGAWLIRELEDLAQAIDQEVASETSEFQYQARLEAAKGWAKQVVSSYLYASTVSGR